MVWLDATTGLRVSELLALRWNDIDFDAGVMHLQRGITALSGTPKATLPRVASRSLPPCSSHWHGGGGRRPTPLRKIGCLPVRG
ncbi:tyrosine-type recombinase/integrase [Tunturiibacter gelidiferens]|uniref:tyrosine-type recombinase/integrase n=1 Tax=Tunturiibacter gelidiferens TaxID=3069689 RepID=UPI003D9B9CF4